MNTNENPLVSVCIPTYNGKKYLREALASVKKQTYKNIEIIISDDGSQDDTLQICEEFKTEADFPVSIYKHAPAGIGANWNNCVEKSSGKWIKFLFQDDVLMPNCIEEMLKVCEKYSLKAACCKRNIIGEFSEPVISGKWYSMFGDLQKRIGLEFSGFHLFTQKDLKKLSYKELTANFFGEPVAFLFKKDLFKEIGMFSISAKQILDQEFSWRILRKYPIGIIGEKLVSFRVHSGQTSEKNKQNLDKREYKEMEKYIIKHFFWSLPAEVIKNYMKYRFLLGLYNIQDKFTEIHRN